MSVYMRSCATAHTHGERACVNTQHASAAVSCQFKHAVTLHKAIVYTLMGAIIFAFIMFPGDVPGGVLIVDFLCNLIRRGQLVRANGFVTNCHLIHGSALRYTHKLTHRRKPTKTL